MDVFRTPSTPTSSEILPSYTLHTPSALDRLPDGPSSSSPLPRPPLLSSSTDEPANPWAREKTGRRDLSAYRNSVVLVDEESGQVLGVLGGEGAVVLDRNEPDERVEDAEPTCGLPSHGSYDSALSDEAVVGYSPVDTAAEEVAQPNDFLVDTNDTTSPDGASTLSPSLRRGFNQLDNHLGPIEPFTPSPSIILTPSTSLTDGLPPNVPVPTPAFSASKAPRPTSHFPDLRSSPSDISLHTMLSPGGLSIIGGLPGPDTDPSNTTIRRVHSRRMRSGTVTGVGGSSFYTAREADGGTWRGSVVGSMRGTILARRGTVKGQKEAEGAPGGGDVLLRFFEESESVSPFIRLPIPSCIYKVLTPVVSIRRYSLARKHRRSPPRSPPPQRPQHWTHRPRARPRFLRTTSPPRLPRTRPHPHPTGHGRTCPSRPSRSRARPSSGMRQRTSLEGCGACSTCAYLFPTLLDSHKLGTDMSSYPHFPPAVQPLLRMTRPRPPLAAAATAATAPRSTTTPPRLPWIPTHSSRPPSPLPSPSARGSRATRTAPKSARDRRRCGLSMRPAWGGGRGSIRLAPRGWVPEGWAEWMRGVSTR